MVTEQIRNVDIVDALATMADALFHAVDVLHPTDELYESYTSIFADDLATAVKLVTFDISGDRI